MVPEEADHALRLASPGLLTAEAAVELREARALACFRGGAGEGGGNGKQDDGAGARDEGSQAFSRFGDRVAASRARPLVSLARRRLPARHDVTAQALQIPDLAVTSVARRETTNAPLGDVQLRGKDSNLDYPVQSRASYR